MTVTVTKAMLIAAYELVRSSPPFLGWRLPDPSEVEFEIINTRAIYGDCDGERIRISAGKHGKLDTLLQTVAHEAIHLHQMRAKLETPNTEHNADFRKRAARVCRIHGWDARTF